MRFLFVISDVGGGHRSSALAVSEAMERCYGDAAEIALADILLELDRWPYNRTSRWYSPSTRLGGAPYAAFWHLTDHVGLVKALSRLNWRYLRPALKRFLARHPADAIRASGRSMSRRCQTSSGPGSLPSGMRCSAVAGNRRMVVSIDAMVVATSP